MERVLIVSPPPGNYNQSYHRLDYILGTKELAEAVTEVGCLTYGEGFNSNHKTMFVDLNK